MFQAKCQREKVQNQQFIKISILKTVRYRTNCLRMENIERRIML